MRIEDTPRVTDLVKQYQMLDDLITSDWVSMNMGPLGEYPVSFDRGVILQALKDQRYRIRIQLIDLGVRFST
jgi:hypothetical protein